jgi:hypothetical protein
MKKTLSCATAAAALAVCLATPASATSIDLFFTSDHCTGGCGDGSTEGQPNGGFAKLTLTQTVANVVTIDINMLNNNTFAGGGFPVAYGFNLIGNPTVTYSNIVDATLLSIPDATGASLNQQVAGAYHVDGFGNFEYGLEYLGTGTSGNPPTTLSFTLTAAGLTLGSFLELSTKADDPANMALDIGSGTKFFADGSPITGPVDYTTVSVPGPIVGAGVPGLVAACGGLFGFNFFRRRRNNGGLPA